MMGWQRDLIALARTAGRDLGRVANAAETISTNLALIAGELERQRENETHIDIARPY